MRDGTTLPINGVKNHFYQTVTSRRSSTYQNTLVVDDDIENVIGKYSCKVTNEFGSRTRILNIRGKESSVNWNLYMQCHGEGGRGTAMEYNHLSIVHRFYSCNTERKWLATSWQNILLLRCPWEMFIPTAAVSYSHCHAAHLQLFDINAIESVSPFLCPKVECSHLCRSLHICGACWSWLLIIAAGHHHCSTSFS